MPGRDRESSSRKDLEAVLQPVLEFLAEEASLGMEPTSLSKWCHHHLLLLLGILRDEARGQCQT